MRKNADVICQHTKDGRTIPLKIRIEDEDGEELVFEKADIALKTEIQIPFMPKSGINTGIYNNAPSPSIIKVPTITFFTNFCTDRKTVHAR